MSDVFHWYNDIMFNPEHENTYGDSFIFYGSIIVVMLVGIYIANIIDKIKENKKNKKK